MQKGIMARARVETLAYLRETGQVRRGGKPLEEPKIDSSEVLARMDGEDGDRVK